MIKAPMYQARIPIGGGGGFMDLRERDRPNPVAEAIEKMLDRQRQSKQDELARRETEARIGQMQQKRGQLIRLSDGSWALVDDEGNILKRIPTPPESGVKVLEEIARISKAGGDISEEEVPQEILDALIGPRRKQLTGIAGLEEYEEETPFIDRQWPRRNVPAGTKTGYRKKVESKQATRPLQEALSRSVGKVKMKAPDGKTYEVPSSEVEDAKKHGWKAI